MNHCLNHLTIPLSSLYPVSERRRPSPGCGDRFYLRASSDHCFIVGAPRALKPAPYLFSPTYPSQRIWKFPRGWRGWLRLRAWNEHCLTVRVLRAKKPAPPSPTRTLFSELPDTLLQSSPNPSETDPYPSIPSSSDPRSGTYPVKFHRQESVGRCAVQIPA